MIFEYDKALWDLAAERAASTPVWEGSHRQGAANEVGALGEVVVENALTLNGIPFESIYETSHDLSILGATVEIKTKDRTVAPQPEYDCSVPAYNHAHQRPDIFIFVSLVRDKKAKQASLARFTSAHIVGWCTRRMVDEQGVTWGTGETDEANGTTFWTEVINLHISDLYDFDDLIKRVQVKL